MTTDAEFLTEAVALAVDNVREGGRPFGAVVVKDGKVVGRGVNRMWADNDPTAHAELLALRAAGATLGTPNLEGAAVYASGQPCPMCLAAMRMSGVKKAMFAYSNDDAEPYGLSTAEIYAELAGPLDPARLAVSHSPEAQGEQHLYRLWQGRSQNAS
ncbi:nucleoside deaminase [Rhizobium sp. KVB221]|uniref:Nucleoside deaminase n=1 Tax=Rhizobium setariae TaxID=2801340 RepID=A0A936YUM7_9HYPH|nr:nucleoside deaminase [Rhizobium setariae]MBL0373302.1 nucleoside deaminase [Rhizobium setariae]